ncbi:MAG: glycosyltransferase [Bdellovibrionota bacterium]
MSGPAELLFPLIWSVLPKPLRERFSAQILSYRARTSIQVPVSNAVVFTRVEAQKKQFRAQLHPEISPNPAESLELPAYSLLSTCFNERGSIAKLLESVLSQQHLPVELIIVDGGSTDGTPDEIERFMAERAEARGGLPFRLRVERGARLNIAEGRNRAAALASEQILAFTDAGCELDRFWSERLLEPFARLPELEVSMGWYRAITEDPFSDAMTTYLVPQLSAVEPATFLPSARSMAVTADSFRLTNGFPEYLSLAGEDSLFDYYLKCAVRKVAFVPDAVVFWHFPKSAPRIFRTAKNYAQGDAEGGKLFWQYYLNLSEVLAKVCFELAIFLCFGLLSDLTRLRPLLYVGAVFAVSGTIRYLFTLFRYHPLRGAGFLSAGGIRKLLAVQLMVWAQFVGFCAGLRNRRRIERRRMERATAGHVVLLLPIAPRRGERSPEMNRLLELLNSSYFVTVICAAYPKTADSGQDKMLFEHQFAEMYLRSAFQMEPWEQKVLPTVGQGRALLVIDRVSDSLSKLAVESFVRLGATVAE